MITRTHFLALLSACLLTVMGVELLAVPGLAVAEEASVEVLDTPASFDFGETEIKTFIETVSDLTGRNFVVDPRVQGTITVMSPRRIAPESVFEFFESILAVYGFTVVKSGDIYKVLPVRNAKSENVPLGLGRRVPDGGSGDRVVTQLYFLDHISANELLVVLRPLLTDTGVLVDHKETNTLIITDTGTNVRRIVDILGSLDTEQAIDVFEARRLEHANASRVAQILEELFGDVSAQRGAANEASPFKVVADERTNTLLLVIPPHMRKKVNETIDQLDAEIQDRQSSIHVYFLENADAQELAKVLTEGELLEDDPQTNPRSRARIRAQRQAQPPSDEPLLSDIAITADPSTNSLVIRCDQEQFEELSRIIKELDRPRLQVLVEALIAEITDEGLREVGVEWVLGGTGDVTGDQGFGASTLPLGAEGSNLQQLLVNPANPPSGLLLGIASGTVTYNGEEYASVSSLARAFETDSLINVLSTPHLMTSDHSEAELVVGERRPFLRSSQVTAEGGTVRSFDYEDIGIPLKIQPHITQNRRVRLKLFQEVTDFLEQQEVGAVTTTKRSVDTTVVVDDKQTIIIGGLMREQESFGANKIPCLGDIPVLGLLFSRQRKRNAKTNLLVFLTPHVLVTEEEIEEATRRKQQMLPQGEIDGGVLDWRLFPRKGLEVNEPEETTEEAADE